MSEKQKDLIYNSDWDILIILDACRYDIFQEEVGEFMQGDLKPVRSEGANTANFLKNTFDDALENTIYVSSSPWVNSTDFGPFEASKYFDKVTDSWAENWNERYGTVLPSDILSEASELIDEENEKRVIIHLMQPHEPYIPFLEENDMKRDISGKNFRGEDTDNPNASKLKKNMISIGLNLHPLLVKIAEFSDSISNIFFSQLFNRGLIGTGPGSVAIKTGKRGLRKEYRKNLRLALSELEGFVEQFEEDIVITADHGELLGENNEYGHCSSLTEFDEFGKPEYKELSFSKNHRKLREVPWFEIN